MSKLLSGGFTTAISFGGDFIFCDTFGIGDNSGIIESNGAYGGDLLNEQGQMAIKAPHIMDYGQVTGSLGFMPVLRDGNDSQLKQVLDWVKYARHAPRTILTTTGATGMRGYGECYFNTISVSSSEGSAVNVDIGFDIIEPIYQNGSFDGSTRQSGGTPPGQRVIPYWMTAIQGVPSSQAITDWSLNFSQNILKKTFCMGLDEEVDKAPLPGYVLFGPLEIGISYTVTVPVETEVASLYLVYDGSATLKVGNDSINMERLTIQSENPEITQSDGYIGYNIDYDVYKIIYD